MKNLYLLGSTGSIGRQVLEIVDANPKDFHVVTLTGNHNVDGMTELIQKYHPEYVAMGSKETAEILQMRFPDLPIGEGEAGLVRAATWNPEDSMAVMVNALVGMCGLVPTVRTIEIGRHIALANKETLVIGGEIIMPLAKKHQVRIDPIDSEHSAIWQCLNGENSLQVKRLIITASGGSFRDYSREQLLTVTVEDALKHPNWSMGAKITIDSSTMMNKGFEVIEAHYLFDIPVEQIETVLHRESYVHSFVEFVDGSLIAQLSNHDMRLPINYALHYPNRTKNPTESLDLNQIGQLTFAPMDYDRFPCLKYAYAAIKAGGIMPCVMNAANEAAVQLFLQHKIGFLQIETIIKAQMDQTVNRLHPTLMELLETDHLVKERIMQENLK